MSLRELYQEIIIDHGRQPRNFGVLANANYSQAGHNPLCGDKLTLHILYQDNVISDIRFEGCGCAISMASASLMTEIIKGKKSSEVDQLFADFHQLVTTVAVPSDDETVMSSLGKLAVFSGVAAYPARVKCATLAWHTLRVALKQT